MSNNLLLLTDYKFCFITTFYNHYYCCYTLLLSNVPCLFFKIQRIKCLKITQLDGQIKPMKLLYFFFLYPTQGKVYLESQRGRKSDPWKN